MTILKTYIILFIISFFRLLIWKKTFDEKVQHRYPSMAYIAAIFILSLTLAGIVDMIEQAYKWTRDWLIILNVKYILWNMKRKIKNR